MAGLGVQLWAFTQDLGQLIRLYGDKSWQTFVSNAGVFQYFGSRDYETAKYAEHLTGMTTMKKFAIIFGKNRGWTVGYSTTSGPSGSSSTSSRGSSTGENESVSIDDVSRPLAYADQMMTLPKDRQILFVENCYPIFAEKHWYFKEGMDAATKAASDKNTDLGKQQNVKVSVEGNSVTGEPDLANPSAYRLNLEKIAKGLNME